MKRMNILRGIALLLAAIMIFTSVPETALTAYAIEEEAELPAAEETVVESTGTGAETQVTTPETVEPETTDDVVINPVASDAGDVQLNAEAPEATGEEVANLGADPVQRTVYAQQVSGGSLEGLTYGVPITNETIYTVYATEASTNAYSKFSYAWYVSEKDADVATTLADPTKTVSDALKLMTAKALPAGFTSEVTENASLTEDNLTNITVGGIPTEAVDEIYYLVIADEGGNNTLQDGTVYSESNDSIVTVPISVNQVTVNAYDNAKDKNAVTSLNFGAATMGYTTYASETDNNVKPQTFIIDAPEVLVVKEAEGVTGYDASIANSDLKYKVVKTNDFTSTNVSNDYTVSFSSGNLNSDSPVTVTVVPKQGLDAGTGASTYYGRIGTAPYYLYVYSDKGNFAPIEIAIGFQVNTNLAIKSIKQGEKTTGFEATNGMALTTPIVVTAEGTDITSFEASGLPAGLTYTWSKTTANGVDTATLTVSGTPAADATTDSATFTVTNKKGYSVTSSATSITINPADLTYKVDTTKEIGANGVVWFIEETTLGGNDYTVTNAYKTITVTNPTANDIDLTLHLYNASNGTGPSDNNKFVIMDKTGAGQTALVDVENNTFSGTLKVKKNSNASFVVYPAASGATTSAALEGFVTITGTGIAEKDIALKFQLVSKGGAVISYPETGTALKAAKVGTAYEDTPAITPVKSGTWELVVDTTAGKKQDGSAGDPVSADNLTKIWGLTFNSTNGKITGTPKKAGTIHVSYKVTLAGTTTELTSDTTIVVAKADSNALEIRDGSTKLTRTYDLGTIGTDESPAFATLNVANLLSVDVNGIVASIESVAYTNPAGTTSAGAGTEFVISGACFGTDGAKIPALGTSTFGITSAAGLPAGKYVVTVAVGDGGEGGTGSAIDNIADSPKITATFQLVVAAAPELSYTNNAGAASLASPQVETLTVGDILTHDEKPTKNVITVDNADSRNMTYTILQGSLPEGLYLDSKTGQIYGTATAGYNWTADGPVTVRGYDSISGRASTFELRYVVNGTTTVAVTYDNNGTAVDLLNKVYVFDYTYAGEDPKQGIDITLKSGTTPVTGNVNISISGNHFRSKYSRVAGLDSDGETIHIDVLKTAESGDYRSQVTISGKEFTTVSFYLYHSVVDKISIDNWYNNDDKVEVTEYSGTVGENFYYEYKDERKDYTPDLVVATVGDVDQSTDITITEVKGKNVATNMPEGIAENFASYNGVDKEIGYINATSKPVEAGTFTAEFKAATTAYDNTNITDVSDIRMGAATAGFANTTFKVYPAQETTATATVVFNIAKGDIVSVNSVAGSADTITRVNSTGVKSQQPVGTATVGNTVATINGQYFGTESWTAGGYTYPANLEATFTRADAVKTLDGYVFNDRDFGYTDNTYGVDLTLGNTLGAATPATATLSSDNFLLTDADEIDKKSVTLSIANGTTTTLRIEPKNDLAAGTYSDTVTISGDAFNDVTFNVYFTVVAAKYAVTVKSDDMLAKTYKATSETGWVPVENELIKEGNKGAVAKVAYLYSKKSSNEYQLKITVADAGNQGVTNFKVYEVADEKGTDFPGGSLDLKLGLADDAGTTATINRANALTISDGNFYVGPADNSAVTTANITGYIKVAFGTGDNEDFIVIPVNYLIYEDTIATERVATGAKSDSITTTPATPDPASNPVTAITVKATASEGDAAKDAQMNDRAFTVTVENKAASAKTTDYIYGMKGSIVDAVASNATEFQKGSNFNLVATGASYNNYFEKTLPGSANKRSFKVTPKAGLKAGTYTAKLHIEGLNMANIDVAISYTVGISATDNANAKFNVYPDSIMTGRASEWYGKLNPKSNTLSKSEAERLWNTLIVQESDIETANSGLTVAITDSNSTAGTVTTTIGTTEAGTYTIVFNCTVGTPTSGETIPELVSDFTGATISKPAGACDVLKITVPDAVKEASIAGTNMQSTGYPTHEEDSKTYIDCIYTGSITITPYFFVEIVPNLNKDAANATAVFSGTEATLTLPNGVYPNVNATTKAIESVGVLVADADQTETVADETLAYYFKPDLPAVKKAGYKFADWREFTWTSGGTAIDKTAAVTTDMKIAPQFSQYNWPDQSVEADKKNIVWTWNADNDGASVTLKITSKETTSPQTVTLTGSYDSTTSDIEIVRSPLTGSCLYGESYKYTARIRSTSDWKSVANVTDYTDVIEAGDTEGAEGHTWVYNTTTVTLLDGSSKTFTNPVSIDVDSATGKVTVTAKAVCNKCGEEKELKYLVKEEDVVEATCTTQGTHAYSLYVYKLDKSGNSTSNDITYANSSNATIKAQWYKEVTVPALGHSFGDMIVDWVMDEKTGEITGIKNAYVICSTCGERVDLNAKFTPYDEAKGYALAKAAYGSQEFEIKGYPVLDSDCTFSDPVWTWSADYTTATVTFKRSYQGKELDTKTFSATSTPAVTISKTNAALYTVYTASVDINGKTYSSTAKDPNGNRAGEDGVEDGYIEFFFDGYAYGDDVHVTYNGAKQTPRVIVVNGSKQLVEGVDYTVTYKNNIKASVNTKAGVATATIKGKGNYTGTDSTLTFIIDPVDISDEDLVHVSGNAGVAGKAIKPILTFGGKALGAKDSDIASQFKALGKLTAAADGKTVTVTGKGNFKGTLDVEVSVLTKAELIPIKVASMTLKSTPYTGEPITLDSDQDSDTVNLKVVAKTTGETLYENDNYTVSYSNNVNAGTVKVVIAGIAPYTGKITKSFKITPAKAANLVVENRENLTGSFKRTGATPSEALVIFDETNNKPLVNGRDYTIKYKNNKKVGTATAVVTYKGNYKGHAKDNVTFTVTPAVFNKNGVDEETTIKSKVVWNTTKATAKGKYYTPAPQIMIDGVLLTSKEYTAVYTDADTGAVITAKTALSMPTADKPINVNVTVTPKSTNYTTDGYDPIVLSYQIVAPSGIALNGAKLAVMTTNAKGKTVKLNAGYTGEPITFWSDDVNSQGFLQLTIGKGKSATVLTGAQIEDKFDIQYVNNVQKGTATVIITPNDETYSGSVVGTFKIKAGLINWIKK